MSQPLTAATYLDVMAGFRAIRTVTWDHDNRTTTKAGAMGALAEIDATTEALRALIDHERLPLTAP